MTSFHDLGLAEPLLMALDAEGYTQPTPIQSVAIPHLMSGRDVLGIAQTGTGKTAAFALPLLQRLINSQTRPRSRACRILVLTPTRELAVQVAESFVSYGRGIRFNRTTIFGGVSQGPQIKGMARGVDVLVATPGRLLDLMNQGHVALDQVEAFVLDEADRMLAMGFIQDVRRIVSRLPKDRQTVMFSATMPPAIAELAETILHRPERVEVTPESTTAERISQTVMFVGRADKRAALEHLFSANGIERALVFTRTKHGANRLAESLEKAGFAASAIHGNKSQAARQHALNSFRDGQLRALVATDIAARGIDVEGLTHVINYELPNEPESYVHRIGRTARAGSEGAAISLCELEEVAYLRDIEKSIRQQVPVEDDHPWHCTQTHELHISRRPAPRPKRNGGGHRLSEGQEESGQRHAGGGRRGPGGRPRSDFGRGEGRDFGRSSFGRGEGRGEGARPSFRPHEGRPHEGRTNEGRSYEGRPAEARGEGDRFERAPRRRPEERMDGAEGGRFREGGREGGRDFGRERGFARDGGREGGRDFNRDDSRSAERRPQREGGFERKDFERKDFDRKDFDRKGKPAGRGAHPGHAHADAPHGKPHGARSDAPRRDDGRHEGARADGARRDPRHGGPHSSSRGEGNRHEGGRHEGRHDHGRHEGRHEGSRHEGARADGARRGEGKPFSGKPAAGKPSNGKPKSWGGRPARAASDSRAERGGSAPLKRSRG